MQVQGSLVELKLHHILSNVGNGEAALGTDADDAAAHAEFSA
jgi:hypothetical protein